MAALTDAQQQIVDDLRAMVGEFDEDDAALFDRYFALGSLNATAAAVWSLKAASAADLIDVREGSSTRNLSQLRGSYLDMATRYAALAAAESPGANEGATRTRMIARRPVYPAKS